MRPHSVKHVTPFLVNISCVISFLSALGFSLILSLWWKGTSGFTEPYFMKYFLSNTVLEYGELQQGGSIIRALHPKWRYSLTAKVHKALEHLAKVTKPLAAQLQATVTKVTPQVVHHCRQHNRINTLHPRLLSSLYPYTNLIPQIFFLIFSVKHRY